MYLFIWLDKCERIEENNTSFYKNSRAFPKRSQLLRKRKIASRIFSVLRSKIWSFLIILRKTSVISNNKVLCINETKFGMRSNTSITEMDTRLIDRNTNICVDIVLQRPAWQFIWAARKVFGLRILSSSSELKPFPRSLISFHEFPSEK